LDDNYTAPMRWFLGSRGHAARGWGLGVNLGHWSVVDAVLKPQLDQLCERHGTKVSLVGASIGGLFARAIALRWPEQVRCVVTLAASVTGSTRANHVWPFYELMTGQAAETLKVPAPPVPSTSVYSRVDGLNNWRTCLQPAAPCLENVEVLASHHGLALHAATFYLLADRLAQPEGAWAPFRPPAAGAAFYPDTASS
jgi:pimeloyl-ACP methyl ester carboxylesterase